MNTPDIKMLITQVLDDLKDKYIKRDWKNKLNEFGSVLWAEGSKVVFDDTIESPDTDAVRLYPVDVRRKILNAFLDSNSERSFCGDWHVHPPTNTIQGQILSPSDLFGESVVAGDLWKVNHKDIEHLSIAPHFNVVLLLKHGDFLVVTRSVERKAFTSIAEQENELAPLHSGYTSWHYEVQYKYDMKPSSATPEVYRETMAKAVGEMNGMLNSRIGITFLSSEEQ